MFVRTLILVCLTWGLPNLSVARSLDINISDDALRSSYSRDQMIPVLGDARMEFGFAVNDNDDLLGSAGLAVFGGPVGDKALEWSLGARVYTGSFSSSRELLAFALGGNVRFSPDSAARFGLSFGTYYAPKIVSFSDSEGYLESELSVDYKLFDSTRVYLGWQRIKADFAPSKGDVTFAEGAMVGVRIGF